MSVRFVLVALVAALGLELGDLATWANSGRDWIVAQIPEWSALGFETDSVQPSVEVVEVTPGRVDLAFEAALEATTSDFVADLRSVATEPTAAPEADLAKGSRMDRISEAVRITRKAVDAWSEVMQTPAEPATPDDSVDTL